LRKLPKTISHNEFLEILKGIKEKEVKGIHKNKIKLAFMLGFYQCLRVGEVPKLLPDDVDMERGMLHIRQAKGQKDRDVPIMPPVLRGLRKLPIECSVRTLQRAIKRVSMRVIGKDIHFHTLRHCVNENTLILGKTGWKSYKNLKDGEEIYTLNLKTNEIELKPVKQIHKYNFNGYLNRIKNKYIDYSFTDEHKLVVRKRKSENGNSYWGEWRLSRFDTLGTQFKHKLSGYKRKGEHIGTAKAGLLGWILSDGCIKQRKQRDGRLSNRYEVVISQSLTANKNKCDIIKQLFLDANIPFSMHKSKPTKNGFNNKEYEMVTFRFLKDFNWIFDWINFDRTPKFDILNLRGRALKEIYKMMMLGDGTKTGEYCSQNIKRIEFMALLCALINKRALVGEGTLNMGKKKGEQKYRTYITNRNDCQVDKKHISKEKYKGLVWCPETENGTFIAKSNGKILVTGNSGATFYLNEKGVDIRQIQTLLGHSRISTTEIYTHVTPSALKKVFDKIWEEE